MIRTFTYGTALALALALSGCDSPKKPVEAPAPETALPELNAPNAPAAVAFKSAGQPVSMKPATENGLQGAASVVELNYLQKQGDLSVKLFGTVYFPDAGPDQGLSRRQEGVREHLAVVLPDAKIGVVGVNGSGKSTLLKIMAGLDKEFTGEAKAADGIKRGYLEQEPTSTTA
jgi:hypothetical protein